MKYDFDKIVNRRGTDSLKWDVQENELPMWVADMDFETAPQIKEALLDKVNHGNFGYNIIPDSWAQSYQSWWKRRHDLEIKKEWLIFSAGVIPTISSAVRKLTTPNEKVVILTPVYNIFFNSIINNGCRVLECPLKRDENYNYEIDFEDLEAKLSNPQTTLLIWCNPHNPIGIIWDKETQARVGALCKKHGVTVISDEIHCDITRPAKDYVPFASCSEDCKEISITCVAPTKCFSIPGIQTSAVFVPDKKLRHKVWRALNTDEVAEPNSFAVAATEAAFNQAEDWVEEMREYVFKNRDYAVDYINKNIPDLKPVNGDATYLLWVDISGVYKDGSTAQKEIRKNTGLYVSEGNVYGEAGKDFIRINLGCSFEIVKDGMERLKKAIDLAMAQ